MTTRDKGITLPFYSSFISVKDPTYGAKGDGVTNDAAAIQAALTAAAGGTLVIPFGTYLCGSTTLSVPAGTTILAYGAALNWTSHVTGVSFVGSASVRSRVFGGKFSGAGNASYNVLGICFYSTGTNNAPAAPTYVLGYELHNVWIDGWANYGVNGSYLKEPKVFNCKITNIGYAGVGGLSWTDGIVDGNYIDSITPGTSSNVYGVFIDRSNGTGTAEPVSTGCKIINNTIKNATIWEAIDTHAGQDFIIAKNNISGCRKGIVVTESLVTATPTFGPKRVVIAENTIQGSSANSAIVLNGASAGVGSTTDAADGCSIIGNTILDGGLVSDTGGTVPAIYVRSTTNCKINGNTLNGSYGGVCLDYDNLGIDVSGNTFTDWRSSGNANIAAVYVNNNNNKGYIGGNTFQYLNVRTSTNTCVRSIDIAAGRAGLDLTFGPCSFIGVDATHLTANWGTTTGINKSLLKQISGGPQALTAGAITVGFSPRFPSVPTVTISNVSALNPFRVTAVAADSFSVAGTGTDTFNWTAST